MARGKRKKRTAAQRRATARMLAANKSRGRHRKHHHKKHHGRNRYMAKSKRRRGKSHHKKTHHRRRRSHFGGGGGRGLSAVKSDVPRMLVAAAYGKVESLAAADANFFLNKVPRPIAALGYTGNIAAALYLATLFTPNKYVRLGASTVATIATYKLGKQGKLYDSSETTTIGSDYGGDAMEGGGDERIIDQNMMGALDAEATEFGMPSRQGVQYDDVVQEASTRV